MLQIVLISAKEALLWALRLIGKEVAEEVVDEALKNAQAETRSNTAPVVKPE